MKGLIIALNYENNNNVYDADSSKIVNNMKNIKIVSDQREIILKRYKTLFELPLFQIENGALSLGEENMRGKIIIDGNNDNVASYSHLDKNMS